MVIALRYVSDSHNLLVSLPKHKEDDVISHCNILYKASTVTIRYVAHDLGKIILCLEVIPLGCANYHFLEHDKIQALQFNGFNYNGQIMIS